MHFSTPAVAALAAALFCACAHRASATPREDLANAAQAFEEAALRNADDSSLQSVVRKWTGPIRVAVRNPGKAPTLVPLVMRAIRNIADIAGLSVSEVDKETDANFVVFFDENETAGRTDCHAWAQGRNGVLTHGEIKVNPATRAPVDYCIAHEPMHAFGFLSHPHGADSVLSYVYHRTALTALDRDMIMVLYDPSMKPGTLPLKASVQGCALMARVMSIGPADAQAVCEARRTVARTHAGESFVWATATLRRTAGGCGDTATYMVDLYADKVSFGFADIWRTFTADAGGAFGNTFTVKTTPNPIDLKIAGNLRSRVVSAENLTRGCRWEGKLD